MHNAAFAAAAIDAVYVGWRVVPADLPAAIGGLRALRMLGVSVTVPHKQAVSALVDRLTPHARAVGAVNCLELTPAGELVGHNTDAGGFVDGLVDGLNVQTAGVRAVLLGSGGAARAVRAGLLDAGAERVTIVARTPARARAFAAAADIVPWEPDSLSAAVRGVDLVVDCTAAGLTETTETALPCAVPVDALEPHAIVCSLIYHREPALLATARARGLRTLDGALMLVHQGARAFRTWTNTEPPLGAMKRAMYAVIGRAPDAPDASEEPR
jgi:shikimate dehydrogenase